MFLSKESYSNINLDFFFKCLSLGFYVFVFSFCGHSNFITDAGKLNILWQKHTVNFSYTFEINRNTLYIYSKCETDRVGWTKQFIRMRREQFLFLIILSSANLNSLPRNNNRNWKFFVNVLSNAYVLRKTFWSKLIRIFIFYLFMIIAFILFYHFYFYSGISAVSNLLLGPNPTI